MKTSNQRKLSVGKTGNILIDNTNKESFSSDFTKKDRKRERTNDENRPPKIARKDGIFVENRQTDNNSKIFASIAVQTDMLSEKDEKSTIDTLTNEKKEELYYKELSETQKKALIETLEENRLLAAEVQLLKKDVEVLKKDNELLEDIVNEAKEMALIIQQLPDNILKDGSKEQ